MIDTYWTRGRPIPRILSSIDDLFTCGASLDEPFILSPANWQPGDRNQAPRLLQALLTADPSNLDDELPNVCDPKPLALVASENKKRRSSLRIAVNALENYEGGFPASASTGNYHYSSKQDEKVPNNTIKGVLEAPNGVQPLIKQGNVELQSQLFDLRESNDTNELYPTGNITLVHIHTSSNPTLLEQKVVMISRAPDILHTGDDDSESDDMEEDMYTAVESEGDMPEIEEPEVPEPDDDQPMDDEPKDDESDGSEFDRRNDSMEEIYNPKAMSDNLRQGETLYLPPNWKLQGRVKANDNAKGPACHGWVAIATWSIKLKAPLSSTQL
ncbi:hypothetical protein NLI96_g4283 [Meripilus lineatus]|uniref:Uncharacterized protein n=1 Tax=Meripilus lineatus TaxID=2056292 RepID=A0AAD5V774_9APHY|nr:hypothetical protein NLI96_g4283 [Physisporinus lineatus]